ncbi:DoxX family protein [Streptomyces sp. NBC_01012]|uniref:DoxX family protein n=1 Tax=Streptomyces sp. NBC_01012 TaxID=2903717 RepID=UPI00386385F1|nr:DoxX family protein [Streptomyces sp. NBC_01012]
MPPLTGIAVVLAVVAAVGLALVQVGGLALHLSRGEARVTGLNVVLLVLAAVAVWLGGAVWL